MSQIQLAWGSSPTEAYEALAQPLRGVFQRIREGAISRELERRLPVEEIQWLKQAGFTALRVPRSHGGSGIQLTELFALLIELGEADSNVVQALRSHMAFVENVLYAPDSPRRERWLQRLGRGEIVGGARSEAGDVSQGEFSTQLRRDNGQWLLNGSKFYTTGCLYADWLYVGATDAEGVILAANVRREMPGVEVVDDWDGFGQRLTASGTTHFHNVVVDDEEVDPDKNRFRYSPAFLQTVHLTNLAGIGRAICGEAAAAVAQRKRTYSNGNGPRSASDPQILQVIGQLRGAAYSAGAIASRVAAAVQRAEEAHRSGDTEAEDTAVAIAELETAQSQTVITELITNAATQLFDALGASATLRPQGLDRFWRNARTLSSHNPRIYKDRIVGDYAVNGTLPPTQWRVGVVNQDL
jgi:alkylation response protein AidB-like acyl-CoA dehydrogenase